MTTPFLPVIQPGLSLNNKTVTSDYTIDSGIIPDVIISCNFSSGGLITLPQPTFGRFLIINDISGNALNNNIEIDPHGEELINGNDYAIINSDYGELLIYSDGNNWYYGVEQASQGTSGAVISVSPGPISVTATIGAVHEVSALAGVVQITPPVGKSPAYTNIFYVKLITNPATHNTIINAPAGGSIEQTLYQTGGVGGVYASSTTISSEGEIGAIYSWYCAGSNVWRLAS
jgi:hypothetical protein